MNNIRDDFTNYYDEETFKAFKAISSRPHWRESIGLGKTLEENEKEIWELLCYHNTYVYLAGHASIEEMLDTALSKIAGSKEKWQRKKAELIAGERWVEIIY